MSGLETSESINGRLSLSSWLNELDTDEFWSYNGSLTTPPCTEGVKWSVLKTVQPISREQLSAFSREWPNTRGNGDARATQLLNGRNVYVSDWESMNMEYGMLVGGILIVMTAAMLILASIGAAANAISK